MPDSGSSKLEPTDPGRGGIGRDDPDRRDRHDVDTYGVEQSRTVERAEEQRTVVKPAKTSAAAVFSLVFGLSALLSVLTILLAPLAIVLAIIGIVLGVVGMRMARRTGITGKGVAIGGLTLSVITLLLAVTAAVGVTTFLNDQSAVNRLERQVQQMRDNLPQKVDIPTP